MFFHEGKANKLRKMTQLSGIYFEAGWTGILSPATMNNLLPDRVGCSNLGRPTSSASGRLSSTDLAVRTLFDFFEHAGTNDQTESSCFAHVEGGLLHDRDSLLLPRRERVDGHILHSSKA